MKHQGDTRRPRSVKAEFDPNFAATARGGAVLAEKTMRSLRVRRWIGQQLPERRPTAEYQTADGVYALLAGLLLGGKGEQAAQALREDEMAAEIFGLEQGAPSASTVYRVLCDLAGLPERKREEHYETSGRALPALDMLGRPRRTPRRRRIVPDTPEAATPESRAALDAFVAASAKSCAQALPRKMLQLQGWYVVFGDGTDLEVDGNCFDAAHMGRGGEKLLRWLTLMLGPVIVAEALLPGDRDEGLEMPALLEQAGGRVRELVGRYGRVLALLDAAFFERQVVEPLGQLKWDFIIGANQQRPCLTRLAEMQPAVVWSASGADARRGWAESQVCCFTHLPGGWDAPVTIVARRWRFADELPGLWHYAFVGTRLGPTDLPPALLKKHGYCSAIWMLYGAKQGRENHYKTPLRDFGLHHPPSGRLGIDQAFYALGAVASNLAMVLRYRVLPGDERGMRLWRLRERYFQISGYLVRSGQTLTVRLSGVCVDALRQTLWRQSFATAGRL
jgi:hypothetical protein